MSTIEDELLAPDAEWRTWSIARKQEMLYRLKYDWSLWAREEQRPPQGDWDFWLYLAGRGTGKTRSAAEEAKLRAAVPDTRIAVVGPTHGVVRDVCIEGRSGILSVTPPEDIEKYNRSLGQVWLKNGSVYFGYSSTEPDRLRGPEHHFAWFEEFAAHRYPQEVFDMAVMGLRLGDHPQGVITTTPRPIPTLKAIMADPSTVITRGRTLDNAKNLPLSTMRYLLRRFAGSTLGRQELDGEMLEDIEGALWRRRWIDRDRVGRITGFDEYGMPSLFQLPPMLTICIGVDPAVTSGEEADETGIVVCGLDHEGVVWVLDDLSMRGTSAQWAQEVAKAYKRYGADVVVAERNNGGDMVEETLRRAYRWIPVKPVWASEGKKTRAQPVASMYEKAGQVRHVGTFPELEDQMCSWDPRDAGKANKASPDRMDALVWAVHYITESVYGGGLVIPDPDVRIPKH